MESEAGLGRCLHVGGGRWLANAHQRVSDESIDAGGGAGRDGTWSGNERKDNETVSEPPSLARNERLAGQAG